MADILGKDLNKWDDSLATRQPFDLVETESTGPVFMTGSDFIRSAKINSDWKLPVALPSQATSKTYTLAEPFISAGTAATDVVANYIPNLESMAAQSAIQFVEGEKEPETISEKLIKGTEIGSLYDKIAKTLGMGLIGADIIANNKEYKEKAKTYDEAVELLNNREYPLGKYARRILAETTDDVETRKIVRELYNQSQGIDSSKWYNQAGSIIGAMVPTIVAGRSALGSARMFGANRLGAINTAQNVAKGFVAGQMGGEYAEETASEYLKRTGDKTFSNFTPKDASGLSAIAYGTIGAQIEFIGGVEPVIVGALNKVGLRSGGIKAATKIGLQEGTEEFTQGLTEILSRKIDGTTDKTWGEGIKESLNGAVWGIFMGSTVGTAGYYANRRNLVKGIKTAIPNITDTQAQMVADAMIDNVAESASQDPTLRANLRQKVASLYRDIDIDNKEDRIDAMTDLEYSLIAMDSADRGIELADHELFQGEVNELGWFRAGIPEAEREQIKSINDNIVELRTQLEELNKAKEKDWEKIEEIENKLAQASQYVLEKVSDLATEFEKLEKKYVAKEKKKWFDKNITKGNTFTTDEGTFTEYQLRGDKRNMATFTVFESPDGWIVRNAYVPENMQKKGIATNFYNEMNQRSIEATGKPLRSTQPRTLKSGETVFELSDAGKKLWDSLVKRGVAKKLKDKTYEFMSSAQPMFQPEQFDLADENARLDDIYPAYEGETIEVDGKERTVYNSNGDRIAKSKEALTNFWRWFGDSKVVDEQGRPLVVYHGSKSVFDTFDNTVNQTKERQMGADLGYFFTDSEYVANKFRTKEQQLEEAGYYIENTVREPVTEEKYDAQGRYLGSVHYTKATLPPYKNFGLYKVYLKAENIVEYQGELLGVWDVRESALKSAKASGKDGMIIYKADTGGGIANEYIVFEPTQIKSVDNRGTYSSDTGNIYWQIDKTEAKSPLLYNDPEYRSKRVYLYDKNWDKHIIEPSLVLFDGGVLSITTLANSNFPNNEAWALYKSEGGESVDSFKNIFYYLQQNIAEVIRGPEGEIKGSYERLSDAENKDVLLKALDKTKTYLTRMDGPELKSQIAVLNTLSDNIINNYITPQFTELVTLSDGTHLVTHGISGSPEKVEKFIKDGKVYNPSLYIAEKPSEYGFHSVVLFARPDILKRKDAKIFDRDAYTSTLSREPTEETVTMPNDEILEKAVDVFDKYFDLEYNLYYKHSGSTFGNFALTMESGLENIKDPYYWNSYYVDKEFVKRYIIADAIERGLANVDKVQLYKSQNNGFSLDVGKMAKAFDVPMSDHTLTDVADKALELIAKQENKTRDEVLDSYKKFAVSRKKVVKSTGADVTPENIAQAQREHKDHFGRWRDVYEEIHNGGYFYNADYELLDTSGESGILASIFTREIPFDAMVAEKSKTGRYYQSVESRKKIRKYAIMAAKGNLISHGKIPAYSLPMRPKTNVRAYMSNNNYEANLMFDHSDAKQIVAEIEKMAKRFAKIYKTLTQEEQKKLTTGQVEENSELETKLKQGLEKNGIKDDLVIDYALKLMKEVYNHPVTYFEGKILADVNVSDFIGAYVKDGESWNEVARMLQNQGLVVVRGEPTDVKWATIKLEEKLGQDIRFQNRVSGAAPKTYRGAYIPQFRFILRANKMDASTLSHELAHDWMEANFARYRSGKQGKDFMKAWGALEKALGIPENATSVPQKASETFARAYEAWIVQNEDWAKLIAVDDKDKDAIEKLMKDYQNDLRDIYNDISNPYFKQTWGKLGELKPELKAWFDRVVNITDLDVMVERGEMTEKQAGAEKLNRAIDTVIETTTDEETKQALTEAKVLNDTSRYEVEGGNKNSIQQRLSILAKDIDENNMALKGDKYDTRRDMMAVAEAADNFVKTRLDDALAIINGEMAEVEGLYKEDLYTALERLAVENGDLGLIDELKNSEVANKLAKELGQRVAGFRNFKQSTDIDVVSALKSLDMKFNKALDNKKAKQQYDAALKLLDESLKQQDKVADKELDNFLEELKCK